MSDRARQLIAYVRSLSDHDLNDLLVELPRERFAALAGVALARPCVLDALALSFHRAVARQGEATRWDVLVSRPLRKIGAVARQIMTTDRGEAGGWVAYARPAAQATGETAVQAGGCWPTRARAAAALAWQSPASGARCLALAAYVRALGDDDLGDLLVELPPGRFAALLQGALGGPVEAGEAA